MKKVIGLLAIVAVLALGSLTVSADPWAEPGTDGALSVHDSIRY